MNNPSESFQYDSCIARGICSVNPRTSALIIVLVVYLKLLAKLILKLEPCNSYYEEAKNLFLNTIPLTVSGQEFTEDAFIDFIHRYKELLPRLIKTCRELSSEEIFKNEEITSSELFTHTNDIINSIKLGEKIYQQTVLKIPQQIRDLHQISMFIAKSLSINILDIESYNCEFKEGFNILLKLVDSIETRQQDIEKIKRRIIRIAKIDCTAMKTLRALQEERFGLQKPQKISYSTRPGKAVLVVGSNLIELENILNELKDLSVDIYTHGDMMAAHTFPKFNKYPSLIGQYGQGLENCLIDFATFPGPIILTKHSLHNIENLYRGRLFTTDYSVPKGVIKIENNDFSKLKDEIKNSRGFKNGKICESVTIGYNYNETVNLIQSKIKNKKRVFLIGFEKYTSEQKSYFEKLIKHSSEDTFIISFSYEYPKENLIYINTCFDSYSLIKIYNEIHTSELPITIFLPKCDRNTVSQMIYLSSCKNTKVYVGKCISILLNPSLMNTIKDLFSINSISSVKNDLKDITAS